MSVAFAAEGLGTAPGSRSPFSGPQSRSFTGTQSVAGEDAEPSPAAAGGGYFVSQSFTATRGMRPRGSGGEGDGEPGLVKLSDDIHHGLFSRNSGLASVLSTPQRSNNFLAARKQVDKELEAFAGLLLKAIQEEIDAEASPPGGAGEGSGAETVARPLSTPRRASPVTPPTDLDGASGVEAPDHCVELYRNLLELANNCRIMPLEQFKQTCKGTVDGLEILRRRYQGRKEGKVVLRLLFILTRCTRLLDAEDAGGRDNQDFLYGTRLVMRRKSRVGELPHLQRSQTIAPGEFNRVLEAMGADGSIPEETPGSHHPPALSARGAGAHGPGMVSPLLRGQSLGSGFINPLELAAGGLLPPRGSHRGTKPIELGARTEPRPSMNVGSIGKLVVGIQRWRDRIISPRGTQADGSAPPPSAGGGAKSGSSLSPSTPMSPPRKLTFALPDTSPETDGSEAGHAVRHTSPVVPGVDLLCRNCGVMVRMEDMEEHARFCQLRRGEVTPDERIIQFANTLEERLSDWSENEVERGLDLLRMARTVAALQPDGTLGPADKCKELLQGIEAHECCPDEVIGSWATRIGSVATEKCRWLRCVKPGAPSDPAPAFPAADGAMPEGDDKCQDAQQQVSVSIEDFELIKPISEGAYGKVFLARKSGTLDLFAIKVMRKLDTIRKNAVEMVNNERNILATSDNPFVVRFYYSFTSEDSLFLVMEYLPGGDCYSLLQSLGCLTEDLAKTYIAEAILALEYCHSHGVVHRDVKPDNLLIASDGHIKLTDFGLSTTGVIDRADKLSMSEEYSLTGFSPIKKKRVPGTLDEGAGAASASASKLSRGSQLSSLKSSLSNSPTESGTDSDAPSEEGRPRSRRRGSGRKRRSRMGQTKMKHCVGTPDYLAPELLLGTGHGPEVDWWSLGAVFYEMVTGIPPFNAETPPEIFQNILDRNLEWPSEEDMSPECRDLIERLLRIEPDERLGSRGASEIKMHPFFADVEWSALSMKKAKAGFVPSLDGEEDTSYFQPRLAGAAGAQSSHQLPTIAGGSGGDVSLGESGITLGDNDACASRSESPSLSEDYGDSDSDSGEAGVEGDIPDPGDLSRYDNAWEGFSYSNLGMLDRDKLERELAGRRTAGGPATPSPAPAAEGSSPGSEARPSEAEDSGGSPPA